MVNRFLLSLLLLASLAQAETGPALATVAARASGEAEMTSTDGVVEAIRQTVLAAQVAGAIIELRAKVGDTVKAGQVLARIDARAAEHTAHASQAQVQAARASLDVAAKDFNRQKLLFQKGFISQAALDQSEAVYKASTAQVNAQIAQAGATRSQSDFYTLRAPDNGIVAEVPVVQGEMALPGRAIFTVYDPAQLRVTATIPQTANLSATAPQAIKVELPGAAQKWIVPIRLTQLPTADPNTHTMQLRLDLPSGTREVTPGVFARVWLPMQGKAVGSRVFVPTTAVVRRAELTGVYVVGVDGKPMLRQIRLGRSTQDSIEVLAGVSAGELIATDPQAAAKVH